MKNPTFVLVSMLVILLASACASTFSEEDLIGIWTGTGVYYQFNDDGTYAAARSVDELSSHPHGYGDFRLEGPTLTVITFEEPEYCSDTEGSYELKMEEEDKIRVTLVEDTCAARARVWENVFFRRVSP